MIRFVKDCFSAIINSDGTEGRGHDIVVGYFLKKEDAERAVKGKDTMGSDGTVKWTTVTINVFETYEEYLKSLEDKLLSKALSKLTAEEATAVGQHFMRIHAFGPAED